MPADKRRIRVVSITLPPTSRHPGKVTLSVPARPEAVRVVRAVMRSWAAAADYSLEEIEDLSLAVDEAFSGLLATHPHPARVDLSICEDGAGVDVTATRDAEVDQWPPDGMRSNLTFRVLTSLLDDVRFERTEHGPAIRMIKHHSTSDN